MSQLDPFDFFRMTLSLIATVYATVVTVQSLWGWVATLSGRDKFSALVRRYLVIHALRLRFKSFWGDVLICLLLCVAFGLLWRMHSLVQAGRL